MCKSKENIHVKRRIIVALSLLVACVIFFTVKCRINQYKQNKGTEWTANILNDSVSPSVL